MFVSQLLTSSSKQLRRVTTNALSTRRGMSQRAACHFKATTKNQQHHNHRKGSRQPPFWTFGAVALPVVLVPTTVSLLQGEEQEENTKGQPTEIKQGQETDEKKGAEKQEEKEKDEEGWVALYLDDASQEKLQEHFKQYIHSNVMGKQMTLQYNPGEDEYALIADTIGMENILIEPIAVVTSNTNQILYCDILGQSNKSTANGTKGAKGAKGAKGTSDDASDGTNTSKDTETIRFDSRITSMDIHPYIVLSTTKETIERSDVQETLSQVAAASLLDLSRNSEEFFWSGMLPAVEGGGESNKISVQRISGLTLNSTACTNFRWDEPTSSCKPPGECGFCKFMRAGPCGDVFTAWEDCIDACKKEDTDFVDICGVKTMALKDCVDANPEYYGVLGGGAEEGETPKEK